jgi:hypothetical protein
MVDRLYPMEDAAPPFVVEGGQLLAISPWIHENLVNSDWRRVSLDAFLRWHNVPRKRKRFTTVEGLFYFDVSVFIAKIVASKTHNRYRSTTASCCGKVTGVRVNQRQAIGICREERRVTAPKES